MVLITELLHLEGLATSFVVFTGREARDQGAFSRGECSVSVSLEDFLSKVEPNTPHPLPVWLKIGRYAQESRASSRRRDESDVGGESDRKDRAAPEDDQER